MVAVGGELDTLMAGLACGEVSLLAWEVLAQGADAFCRIGDDAAVAVMRLLARPGGADTPIVAGESAVAGLAAAIAAMQDEQARAALGLGRTAACCSSAARAIPTPHAMRNWSGRAARRSVPRRGGGMMDRLPRSTARAAAQPR